MLVYIHLPFHLNGLLDNSKSSPDSQLCIIMHTTSVVSFTDCHKVIIGYV